MKSYGYLWLICCLPATLTWGQTSSAPAPAGFEKDYPGILRNNIFSRYRKPYVDETQANPVKAPPPPPEESYYVLKGVSRDRETLTAFIEYNNQGHADRYIIGSKVAHGHIQALTMTGLDYVAPGSDPNQNVVTHVLVGQNLLGQTGSASNNRRNSGNGAGGNMTPAARSPSTSAGDVNTSDMMKQLMERRQRELGR